MREEMSHLLIELTDVIFDQWQFGERQLQQRSIDGTERRGGRKGVRQFSGTGA